MDISLIDALLCIASGFVLGYFLARPLERSDQCTCNPPRQKIR